MRGFRDRITTDVDVIATATIIDGSIIAHPAEPLSQALQDGIRRVARDYGLPSDWLNTVIAKQWRGGTDAMPPGLTDDIEWRSFGGLTLGLAGRQPLIALKLYAAIDTGPNSVHTQDLA